MEYPLSHDFILHIDVQPTRLGRHLSISTQWLGAKNPQERQRRFDVTLPPEIVHKIATQLHENTH